MIKNKAQTIYCPKHPAEQIKQLVISQKHSMIDRVQCSNCEMTCKEIISIDNVDKLVTELKNVCDPTLSQKLLSIRSRFDSQFQLLLEELQLIKTSFSKEYLLIKNVLEGRQAVMDCQKKNNEMNIAGFRNLALELSKQIQLQEGDNVQFKQIPNAQWIEINEKINQLEIAWKQVKQKQQVEKQISIACPIEKYSLLHSNYAPISYGIQSFSFNSTQNQFICSNQTEIDNLACCEIKENKILKRQLLANALGYVRHIQFFNQKEEFLTCHGKNGVGFWGIQQGFWEFQCRIYYGNEYILISDISQKNDLITLGCNGGEILILQQTNSNERKVWHVHQSLKAFNSQVLKLIFSYIGNQMSAINQESVYIFYLKQKTGYFKVKQELKGHSGKLKQIQFTLDSTQIFTSSCDRTIRIYRQQENKFYVTINILKFSYIPYFRLNSNSMILITGGKLGNSNSIETGILHFWKLQMDDTWINYQAIQLDKTVYDIIISPDDQYIAINHIVDSISLLKRTQMML